MTALLSANATSLFSGWVRGLAGPQFPLARLPEHLPTALATAGLCQLVYLASFPLFRSASKLFTSLSKAKQIDWATRVVSTAFSSYAVFASLRTVNDPVLGADRLFGYTAAAGHLMAVALGYFIWDLVICMQHVKLFGPGFLVHAICCINIYLWIFKPFLMYFGVRVLLWEASTPFLNAHWFLDKLGMTGGTLQLVNGVCLLAAFFGIRIGYGFITSGEFFYEMMTRTDELPPYLPYIYAAGNLALNALNVYWFYKMIASIRSRFDGKDTKDKKKR